VVEVIRARGKVRRRMRKARRLKPEELRKVAFKPAFEEPEAKHARAEALRRALHIAGRENVHLEKLDFVPAHFIIQWHGWGDAEFLNSLGVQGRGKGHFDLRVQKLTAPTWFGLTLFTDPTKAPTKGKRHLGTVKGYESLVWGGKKPAEHGAKVKEKAREVSPLRGGHAVPQVRKKGLESMGEIKWMSFEGRVRPGGPGNPSRNLWSRMKIVDEGPAVVHRRELDFVDMTLLGDRLRGRWFMRLVKGATKEEREKPETEKLHRKAHRWYFFRWTKEPKEWVRRMVPVALRKKVLPSRVIGKGN